MLTLALVPSLAAEGAALATTIAEWSPSRWSRSCCSHARPTSSTSLRIVGPVLLAIAAGAATVLAPLPNVVQGIVALALYLAVLVALRSIPPELLDAFARRRPV